MTSICSFFGRQAPPALRRGIPLETARICVDCETITGDAHGTRCPHCGAAAMILLTRWVPRLRLADRIVDPARRVG